MRLPELLRDLRQLRISIGLVEGKLKVFDPEKNLTDDLLRALRNHKQTLLQTLTEGHGFTQSDFPNAHLSDKEIAKVQAQYPMLQQLYIATPMQQGMLFHGLFDGTGESYTSQNYCDINVAIDTQHFKQAWLQVLGRHDILRTCFVGLETKQVHQLVLSEVELPFCVLDWSNVPEHEQASRCAALHREDKGKGFCFGKAPLMRVTIAKLSEYKYHLLWSHHHVLTDGWCTPVILREVMQCYQALQAGHQAHLPPPVPFHHYINWLVKQDKERATQFWEDELEGISGATPLFPHRAYAPLVDDHSGIAQHKLLLSETITNQLQQLATRCDTTINVVFQIAWAYLLYRYSGEPSVIFGATVSGRPADLTDVQEMIGLFINTLPVKVDFCADRPLSEQLHIQHSNNLRRDEFSFLALSDIQRIYHENHSGENNGSLFDTIIVFENLPLDQALDEGLNQMPITAIGASEQTNYGLTLTVYCQRQLSVNFSYAESRLSGDDIDYIGLHLEQILRAMASAEVDQPVQKLPMLSRQERMQQVQEWQRNYQVFPTNECIHEWVERQAKHYSNAIAVSFVDDRGQRHQITYEQLNRRANQLAHCLRRMGVKPNTLVGVCVERSVEMVVALLGVLKSGGAYLPLDPDYPQARLHYMVKDSGITQVIGGPRAEKTFASLDVDLMTIDQQRQLAVFPEHNIPTAEIGLTPNDLAYVIYTSGSTGKPKGVMVEHRNVMRLFASTESQFGFGHDDVWSLFHSYAFDFSVWEIWGALMYGGRLVVVSFEASRTPELFCRLVVEEGITVLNQTPSAFYSVSDTMVKNHARHQLRYVVFGGEALDAGRLSEWYRFYSTQTQLVNMYGITETTVHATLLKIDPKQLVKPNQSIGRPLKDLVMLVVNSDGQPQPVGVPGELLIAGGGVARGYLHREELTAQRFVSLDYPIISPYQPMDVATETMCFYRTGDLVSWLPNGELSYHGRIDHQVKIRGFRIELGEIEVLLKNIEWLQDAVVCVREDQSKTQRIVGYVIFKRGMTIADEWVMLLRDHLKTRLPNYMIPAAFVALQKLPITVNGKLDVKSLPEPDFQQQSRMNYVAPRTTIESQLCELWQQVLDMERVGVEDNYFAIGGDSILSIQIIAQAKKAGLNLSVKQLFEAQTISALAKQLASSQHNQAVDERQCQPFELLNSNERQRFAQANGEMPEEIEDVYPLSQLQSGMVYHSQLTPDSAVYHDVFSYHIEGPWKQSAFEEALQYLVQQHEILRTGFELNGERPLQVVYQQIELPLEVRDLRDKTDAEQRKIIGDWHESERFKHFTWQKAPLLRIFIFRRRQQRFQYGFSFHHAILDGWSVARFNQHLADLYAQRLLGNTLPSKDQLPHFRDYIHTEQKALHSDEARNYWLTTLKDASVTCLPKPEVVVDSPLELAQKSASTQPVPMKRTADDSCEAYIVHSFSQISGKILNLSRQLSIPVQYILLAAHVKVLSLVSGDSDVLTCVVNNARMEQDGGDKSLGLFLNSLPFRWMAKTGSWRELINQVNQKWVDNLQYRHYPLSEIQRHTGLTLSEAVFNYTHFHAYSDMLAKGQFKILGGEAYEQSNFAFCGSFNRRVNDDSLSLTLLYNPQRVDVLVMQRMSHYYMNTFQAMLGDINGSHFSTPLLSRAEQRLLLNEWNQTHMPMPLHNALHEMFEQHAAKRPEALALQDHEKQLTYGELEARANQLAWHLQNCGVVVGDKVGLGVGRDCDMIIGILGILKAGAAYVPIDPEYPQQRIQHMLEDSQMTVFITQKRFNDVFTRVPVAKVFLDSPETQARLNQYSPSPPSLDRKLLPNDLIYMIYTSGTTGTPKGVLSRHRGALNLALGLKVMFNVQPEDRVQHFLSLSFDAGSLEWILALTAGASLHICHDDIKKSPTLLSEFMYERNITHTSLPPALLPHIPLRYDYALKALLLGGESADPSVASKWATYYSLYNMYGPTETSICVSGAQIMPGKPLSLGRPLPNVSFYVLDENQQLLPIGAVGELYIGGAGVAKGYLHQEELTRERFVRNPFNPQREERLYRTGDKVRYLADGSLSFEGRVDEQVKLRGFRIELGEIRSKISQLISVNEAFVAVCGENDEKKLIAYVVPDLQSLTRAEQLIELVKPNNENQRQQRQQYTGQIIEALADQLPEYMVPAAVVVLDTLPMSANDKVDKSKLPDPRPDDYITADYQAPDSTLALQLADIWSQVLGVPRIGMKDNFFDLGGHSLLVIKLMSMVNQKVDRTATVRDLFDAPTLGSFVEHLQRPQRQDWQPLVALSKHYFRQYAPIMYFVPGMGVISAAYQPLADALQPQVQLKVLESKGIDNRFPLHESFQDMVKDFVHAIIDDQQTGKVFIAGHSFGGSVAFEIARQLEALGREVQLYMFDSVFYQDRKDLRQFMVEQGDEQAAIDRYIDDVIMPQVTAQLDVATEPDNSLDTWLSGAKAVARQQLGFFSQYQPTGRFKGKLRLFEAEENSVLGDNQATREDQLSKYQRYCERRISLLQASGGHHTMFNHENAPKLGQVIAKLLLY